MKLANQSLKYFSFSVLLVIALWSAVFYLFMLEVIHDNIDEELENQKRLIIEKLSEDDFILTVSEFGINSYQVHEIPEGKAVLMRNSYKDTMLYMQDEDDPEPELEPVRMLTTAFEHNGHFYELSIINSMIEESDLIKNLFYAVVILFLLLVISIVFINKLVLQRLWNPLYRFLGQLTKFRLGETQNKPTIDTKIQEFSDLQQAVATLIRHNEETYEQQKQFIGNASHELQTPLAIMINKLEMMAEKGNLQEEQAVATAEMLNIAERLVRLNKSLLLLTKIENKQFFDNQDVSINTVVQQQVNEFEDTADFKNVKINVTESSQLAVNMDPALANIIISNLLRNALFHNKPDGLIAVEITENTVEVSNTSLHPPLDTTRLFSRFYKSETSSNGTGLGLAIIKAICNLYGFAISYSYEKQQHCFRLRFRAS